MDVGQTSGGGGGGGSGGCVAGFQLFSVRGRWRAVVNAATNPRILAPQSYLTVPNEFNKVLFNIS
jgi:hypothetical protein